MCCVIWVNWAFKAFNDMVFVSFLTYNLKTNSVKVSVVLLFLSLVISTCRGQRPPAFTLNHTV